jgi:DNA polymerase-3 subunit delta
LAIGVPQVVIADALADGVRSMARVWSAGRGSDYELAKRLGMQPWKVKRAGGQARGWTEAGLRQALGVVATLNADVKGAAVDPDYALETAVRRIGAARAVR